MSQHCSRCDRTIDLPGGAVAFCPYCGQTLTATLGDDPARTAAGPAPAGQPIERVGEYRLLRVLGRGGMGVVHEARHERTGRRVAVKLIDVAASPDALERFRREGRLASTVAHPRCVFVLAADEEAGQPFIVMELMPGRTLDDLVRQRGPLPLEEALRHTLDLIDGLQQVHRLGLIHRDVKPSNCFLDAGGRLKVGDFGLARSLAPEAKLTRTGTFVGTPLFASPEQVKGEPLDARADVYSVCATLFFLLTGRAPHDAGDADALAALARVVSDDAPPLRSLRPEVPASLERAVARGLSRQRDWRWPDLPSLRSALTSVQIARPDLLFLGKRFTGYVLDRLLLLIATSLFWPFVPGLSGLAGSIQSGIAAGLAVLCFGLCEGIWGLTPARWLLGVRVFRNDEAAPPGVWRGLLRGALYQALFLVPLLGALAQPTVTPSDSPGRLFLGIGVYVLVWGGLYVVAIAAVLSTARRHNGFRCLHDVLSGTRVVPAPFRRVLARVAPAPPSHGSRPADLPEQVGPFPVRDERWRGGEDRVLGSVDPGLDRPVWLWLRPAGRPALPESRREVDRAARLRWLAQGEEGGARWDAFLAPAGSSLLDAVRGGSFDWPEAREVLEALADELIQAHEEDNFPESLSLSAVWLLPDGQVVLLDTPGPDARPVPPEDLLAEAASLLLGSDPFARHLPRRPMPIHVREVLERLPRFGGRSRNLPAFREHLRATRDRPVHLSRPLRLLHLGVLVALQTMCCPGWLGMALSGWFMTVGMLFHLHEAEQLLADLRRAEAASAAGLVVPTLHPAMRWPAAPRLERHRAVRERLQAAHDQASRYSQARLTQFLIRLPGMQPSDEAVRASPRSPLSGSLDRDAEQKAEFLEYMTYQSWTSSLGFAMFASVALCTCLVTAMVCGGGLRYLLFGMRVVRRNGEPAGPVRCGWRTVLAWSMCVAPLVLARILEEAYWHGWRAGRAAPWVMTLAELCWLLAGALLAASLVVFLISPARSLHDRLAGTVVVPR